MANQLQLDTEALKLKDSTVAAAEGEEEESKVSGILGGLLGMAGPIAGAIPTFRRKPEVSADGGRIAASQAGAAGSRAAVGGASAGHGRTRGLALREGLRSAERNVAQGASRAAAIGAQQDLEADTQNARLQQDRLATGLKLGSALGGGMGVLGTALATARDQGQGDAVEAPQSPVEPSQPFAGAPAQPESSVASQTPQGPLTGQEIAAEYAAPSEEETAPPTDPQTPSTPFDPAAPVSAVEAAAQEVLIARTALQKLRSLGPGGAVPETTPGDPTLSARANDTMYHALMAEVGKGLRSPEDALKSYYDYRIARETYGV